MARLRFAVLLLATTALCAALDDSAVCDYACEPVAKDDVALQDVSLLQVGLHITRKHGAGARSASRPAMLPAMRPHSYASETDEVSAVQWRRQPSGPSARPGSIPAPSRQREAVPLLQSGAVHRAPVLAFVSVTND